LKISKIILENFQSHKYTEIDVDDAITLITGSSDSGKSSVVRALRWVFFNRSPKGNFIQNKKKPARVSLIYSTGDVLVREQGRNLNQYRLNDNVYKALRSDVPPEVRNFHKVALDNCQWQHPHYFLLDETPGNVAKRLNEVADLSIMDESLSVINALIRESGAETEKLKGDVTRIETALTESDWVPGAEKELARAEGKMLELSRRISLQGKVTLTVADVRRAEQRLAEFPDLSGLPVIDEALVKRQLGNQLNDDMRDLMARLEHIEYLNQRLDEMPDVDVDVVETSIALIERRDRELAVRNKIAEAVMLVEEIEEKLAVLPDVDVDVDISGFEELRRALIVGRSQLRGLINNVSKWQSQLKVAEIALVDAEEAYDKLKVELKVCPVCGNKFTEKDNCL